MCSHVSTEISAPIRYLGIQFGYLGKTTKNDRKPMGGGVAGAKRAEGEIKGCGCGEVKSLSELDLSLDTLGGGYPANCVGIYRASDFFVVACFYG